MLGDNGTIALIRNRGYTTWGFPKGKLEEEETDEDAARREIAEEAGLMNLEYIDTLGGYQRHPVRPDGSYDQTVMKDIRMFLFAAEPHATLSPSLETEEAKWASLQHLVDELGNKEERAWFTTVFERVRQAVQRD